MKDYRMYDERITWYGKANNIEDLKEVAIRIFGHYNVMTEDMSQPIGVVQNLIEALDERNPDQEKEAE